MAVNFNSTQVKKALIALGVGSAIIAEATALGIKFHSGPKVLSFKKPHRISWATCSPSDLAAALDGTLPNVHKYSLKSMITAALVKTIQKVKNPPSIMKKTIHDAKPKGVVGESSGWLHDKNEPEVADAKTLMGLVSGHVSGKAIKETVVSAMDLAKPGSDKTVHGAMGPTGVIGTGHPVLLRDATKMYQPVRGSSQSSVYFLVGIVGDVKVAVRYKNKSSLSIRIEGGLLKNKARLTEAGFTNMGTAGTYASMHLSIDSRMVADKALGALLFGIGPDLKTPLPNLDVIYGKGN